VVDCTALEMRHRCKPIGGSNPPLSAILLRPKRASQDRPFAPSAQLDPDSHVRQPERRFARFVMAGLDPAIHVFVSQKKSKTWITGTSPVMTGIYILARQTPASRCKKEILRNQRAQGMPGARAPGSLVRKAKSTRGRHHRYAATIRWVDESGAGRFNVLEIETRYMKGPRPFEGSGLPLHDDNETSSRSASSSTRQSRTFSTTRSPRSITRSPARGR
jgi:hypothetical protein